MLNVSFETAQAIQPTFIDHWNPVADRQWAIVSRSSAEKMLFMAAQSIICRITHRNPA